MQDLDALAAYAQRHISEEPFTDAQKKSGVVVRVVACVRANDPCILEEPSAFVWSVLVFAHAGTPVAPVRLDAPSGLLARALNGGAGVGDAILAAQTSLELEGRRWDVREYELCLPRGLRWFTVRTPGASCEVGRARRNELIGAYFARICNAAADGQGYAAWLGEHRKRLAGIAVPPAGPLVSIVTPAFRTPPDYLRAMVGSVAAQTYENWELVIVNASPDDEGMRAALASFDDARIHVVDCPQNKGIAGNTNVGIAACTGDYVCFLDHDDFVEPQALAAMVGAIQSAPGPVDLVYCDEDSYDEHGRYRIPLFKPPRNIDLLYSNDYVIHWLMVSRSVLDRTARSTAEVDGAQDYDLTLKAFECGGDVVRVPYVLYHWRIHEGSMNNNPDSKVYAQESGRRAIAGHLARRGIAAQVEREKVASTYRADFLLQGTPPSLVCVSLGQAADDVTGALEAWRARGAAARMVRLPADAGATDLRAALAQASEELAVFLAPGVAVDEVALATLAGYFARPEVFSAAPRILLRNGLVDGAGCIVAPDGGLCKMGHCLPEADEGYIGRLHRPYSAAVLDTDCMVCRVADLRDLGVDERFETCAAALADACLRAYAVGRVNVFTPFTTVAWRVGRSLLAPEPIASAADRALLVRKHRDELAAGDPSHNPNFDPDSPHYRLVPYVP